MYEIMYASRCCNFLVWSNSLGWGICQTEMHLAAQSTVSYMWVLTVFVLAVCKAVINNCIILFQTYFRVISSFLFYEN